MVLLFLVTYTSFSQNILEGTIISKNNQEPIPYCSVLVKSSDSILLAYTTTTKNGIYTINLPENKQAFIIETSIITHIKSIKKLVVNPSEVKAYELNFELEERITNLDEVLIKTKKPPITVKKDTTIYNIDQFKNGSERVVQDLLKKLPGISITDNGLIKFKGKQVTRLLLDGDNLFNDNYTVGTKNISADIVESVQAIEDYNANPLLKNVKSSDDVAVNLVLKKGKTDVSGDAEIGFGVNNKHLLKSNIISVSKKIKAFSTVGNNNIGENNSPYNFVSNNIELSKINEYEQRASGLIANTGFNSNLTANRINVNNSFFGSANGLYKFNKQVSFKANYNLYKDRLYRQESNTTLYNFDMNEITISTHENFIKRPLVNTLEYELIYNINKKSLLTSIGKWDSQNIITQSDGINNNLNFENSIHSNDVFYKNELEYTYKINNNNVFQFFGHFAYNVMPQDIRVLSGTSIINQNIHLKKNYYKLQASWFSKNNKTEFATDLGYSSTNNNLNTALDGITLNNAFLTNAIDYNLNSFYGNLSYQFRVKKWRFSLKTNTSFVDIALNDSNISTNYQNTIFNIRPILSAQYYLNKVSSFYANYSLSNQLPNTNMTHSGVVLINNRTILNNDFTFNLFKNQLMTVGYKINDFYNLFQLNTYVKYSFRKFGYVNKLVVNQDTSFFTSIVDVTNNRNYEIGFDLERYVHPLKSTINLKSAYTVNEYQNIINTSGLRDNTSKSLINRFDIRTGFKGPINFENKVLFNTNIFETNSNNTFSNTMFQNDFSVQYVKESFQINLTSQYFNPDLNKNVSGDFFLDASIRYKTKNGKLEYGIKANNLLNKNVFRSINNSDFSTSIFEHNLLERFVLLSINFRF